MTSRERLLTAIDNKKPDRLPCQVHGWMQYFWIPIWAVWINSCDMAEAAKRVGGKLFFIGGFDQNAGFEKDTKRISRSKSAHSLMQSPKAAISVPPPTISSTATPTTSNTLSRYVKAVNIN